MKYSMELCNVAGLDSFAPSRSAILHGWFSSMDGFVCGKGKAQNKGVDYTYRARVLLWSLFVPISERQTSTIFLLLDIRYQVIPRCANPPTVDILVTKCGSLMQQHSAYMNSHALAALRPSRYYLTLGPRWPHNDVGALQMLCKAINRISSITSPSNNFTYHPTHTSPAHNNDRNTTTNFHHHLEANQRRLEGSSTNEEDVLLRSTMVEH
jgi:hypothetical protein